MISFGDAARAIERSFDRDPSSKWKWSPFAWMRRLPTVKKHEAAKLMLVQWLKSRGCEAKSITVRSASYLQINNKLVSLKISIEWEEGVFVFQQIRRERYDFALLMGISPSRVKIWTVPRRERRLFSTPQHVGPTGVPANHLLRIRANDTPKWLAEYRGFGKLIE